jgi:hypothetical protein
MEGQSVKGFFRGVTECGFPQVNGLPTRNSLHLATGRRHNHLAICSGNTEPSSAELRRLPDQGVIG